MFRMSPFLLKETTYHSDGKGVKNIFIKNQTPHINTYTRTYTNRRTGLK